jgi:hypothetical protein
MLYHTVLSSIIVICIFHEHSNYVGSPGRSRFFIYPRPILDMMSRICHKQEFSHNASQTKQPSASWIQYSQQTAMLKLTGDGNNKPPLSLDADTVSSYWWDSGLRPSLRFSLLVLSTTRTLAVLDHTTH